MKSAVQPRSPLWIIVLSLACEEPMHPYRMATLIRQRGKDLVANVAQRNSVNQTIEALRRAGLVAKHETKRNDQAPEHTSYAATAVGKRTLKEWSRNALSTPAREFPLFPAALSTLDPSLTAAELRSLLEARAEMLRSREAELAKPVPDVPRIFLIESEYMLAVIRAEIAWLRDISAELASGRLAFPTMQELRRVSAEKGGPSTEVIRKLSKQRSMGKPTALQSKRATPQVQTEPRPRRMRKR